MFIGTIDTVWHTITLVSVVKAPVDASLIQTTKVVGFTLIVTRRHKRHNSCTHTHSQHYDDKQNGKKLR